MRETGESTKCLWVGVLGLIAWGEGAENIVPPTTKLAKKTTLSTNHNMLVVNNISARSNVCLITLYYMAIIVRAL